MIRRIHRDRASVKRAGAGEIPHREEGRGELAQRGGIVLPEPDRFDRLLARRREVVGLACEPRQIDVRQWIVRRVRARRKQALPGRHVLALAVRGDALLERRAPTELSYGTTASQRPRKPNQP